MWGIMHAKFQPSSFNGVGGRRGGDRRKDEQGMSRHVANFPLALLKRDNNNLVQFWLKWKLLNVVTLIGVTPDYYETLLKIVKHKPTLSLYYHFKCLVKLKPWADSIQLHLMLEVLMKFMCVCFYFKQKWFWMMKNDFFFFMSICLVNVGYCQRFQCHMLQSHVDTMCLRNIVPFGCL